MSAGHGIPAAALAPEEQDAILPGMKTTMTSRGQIVLPAELRNRDDMRPGQIFRVRRVRRGEYRLVAAERPRNQGLADALLACPVKGWLVPVKSESTGTL